MPSETDPNLGSPPRVRFLRCRLASNSTSQEVPEKSPSRSQSSVLSSYFYSRPSRLQGEAEKSLLSDKLRPGAMHPGKILTC
ncbi:uncharacterized [Tachysurus ichikawai]